MRELTSLRIPLGVGAGLVAGVVGLLPWIIDGARLPLQNLWGEETLPGDMPFALLPLSQYYATEIVALLAMGGVLAGLAARMISKADPPVWPASAGLILVQTAAILQSFLTLGSGLSSDSGMVDPRARLYFVGMLAGTLLASLLAHFVLWLVAWPGRELPALGYGLAAVPIGHWISYLLTAPFGPGGAPGFVMHLPRWVPVLVVAVALGWLGVRAVGAVIVWAIDFVLLLVMPPLFTAVQAALGMRVLRGNLRETTAYAFEMFAAVLPDSVLPAVAAIVAALLITLAAGLVARNRTRPGHPERRTAPTPP
ncbi:MAG TPA: hypothetical protein VFC82_06505 [Actinomycetaceae bacterium]|nr:hypothetical protein [Actinomycetaceae bacterium]